MGVYGLTSVSGSPGVTTAAVAWAMTSERPTLIIEADLVGGSPILAGMFRAEQPHDKSLLALTQRPVGMTLVDHIWAEAIPLPGTGGADKWVVPGVATGAQAGALRTLWPTLGRAAQHLATEGGYDVLIDLGRTGTPMPHTGLLPHLDAVAVFTWAHLPGLHVVDTNLEQLRSTLGEVAGSTSSATTRTGLVAVDPAGPKYGHAEVAKAAAGATPVLGTLPYDPSAARTYHDGTPPSRRSFTQTATGKDGNQRGYDKSITEIAAAVRQQAITWADAMKGTVPA